MIRPAMGVLYLAIAFSTNAHDDTDTDLYSYSLDELMSLTVETGGLIDYLAKDAQSAITTITLPQIQRSSAKNIASLLEQHVPGFVLMEHSEGSKLGLRGLIAAENYKMLLLLNGKNITNMVYEGVLLEIDHWDLNDIEKIEVIRGPGSATYGTGAIAGVINIITKNSTNIDDGLSVGYQSLGSYRSESVNFQYSKNHADFGVYFFSSITNTEGQDFPDYYQMSGGKSGNIRYVGKHPEDITGPQPHLADGLGRPQIKAHLDLNAGENFRMWARYTQAGQSHSFHTYTSARTSDGKLLDDAIRRVVTTSGFTLAPEYKIAVSNNSSVRANILYNTQEYVRRDFLNVDWPAEHFNNARSYAFSQNTLDGSLLYSFENASIKFVTGYEYKQITVGPPWNKPDSHLWIVEGSDILSGPESVYLQYPDLQKRPSQADAVFVGEGIQFRVHSHVVESSYDFSDSFQLMYSHRLDHTNMSDSMFSPRISLISELNDANLLRLTVQKASRLMPIRAQYLFDRFGDDSASEHESLKTIEIAYNYLHDDNFSIRTTAYMNDIHAVGFTGDELQYIADFSVYGVEIEAEARLGAFDISFSHAHLKLIDMEMNRALKTGGDRNNISFADYYYHTTSGVPLTLESQGNSLNNWSDETTRLDITHKAFEGKLTSNLNARFFWGFDGTYDEMHAYQKAYDNYDVGTLSPEDQQVFAIQQQNFERERELIDQKDAYGNMYAINASVTYNVYTADDREIRATLFVDQLFGSRIRHYVSTGSRRSYPERLSFMYEPRTVGLKLQYSLF